MGVAGTSSRSTTAHIQGTYVSEDLHEIVLHQSIFCYFLIEQQTQKLFTITPMAASRQLAF